MRRIRALALAVVAVLAIVLYVGLEHAGRSHAPMPVYLGRTAREWLDQVFTTNQAAAFAAFRAMGTNARPAVVEALHDSAFKRAYAKVYPFLPRSVAKHFTPPASQTTWNAAELMLLNNDGLRGAAFPELAEVLRDKRNRARLHIMDGIRNMAGPEQRRYAPVFIECLKDPDWTIRVRAADSLGGIGPTPGVLAALTAALQDPTSTVRLHAAITLWNMDKRTPVSYAAAKSVLQAEAITNGGWVAIYYFFDMAPDDPAALALVLNTLKGTDRSLRLSAAAMLYEHASSAKAAVPTLLDLLPKEKLKDPEMHSQLLQTLRKIDPAAAAKYEESQ